MDVDFTKFGGVPVDAPTASPAVDFAKLGGVPVDAAPQAAPDPTAGMSNYEKGAAGMGGAFAGAGRAIKQASIGLSQGLQKIPGIGQYLGSLPPEQLAQLSQQSDADIAEAKRLDAPLLATGAGKVGNIAGNVAMFAPTALIPGANTYTGAALTGAIGSALTTPGDLEERAKAGAIGGAGGVGGKYIGGKLGDVAQSLRNRPAQLAAQEAQDATKNATLAASQEAGYTVPPTMANPTLANKALEGLSGKAATAQAAAVKNQSITNDLARKSLGLAEDAPLTKETLQGVRQQAGQAYDSIRGAGTITTDAKYTSDLLAITKKYQGASADFPELAKNEIGAVVDMVNKKQFDASAAIDAISILRDKTDAAFRSGDKALGNGYKAASTALEDAIDRNLAANGQADLLGNFRNARQTIAKTYSVEKALNESTGNVSAQKLAAQLGRGKPLSDELKTAAQFAQAYPKAAQEITSSMPGISPLDYGFSAGAGLATGNPLALAGIAARPAVRGAILSQPYQRLMTTPNYQPGRITNSLAALANIPGAQNTLRLLAETGGRGSGTSHAAQQ
jgi:hypothetical protein